MSQCCSFNLSLANPLGSMLPPALAFTGGTVQLNDVLDWAQSASMQSFSFTLFIHAHSLSFGQLSTGQILGRVQHVRTVKTTVNTIIIFASSFLLVFHPFPCLSRRGGSSTLQ